MGVIPRTPMKRIGKYLLAALLLVAFAGWLIYSWVTVPAALVEHFAAPGATVFPDLGDALRGDLDHQIPALRRAAQLGPAAKETIPDLIAILVSGHRYRDWEAIYALTKMGPDATGAVAY